MLHYNITAKGVNSINGFSLLLWCFKTYKDNPHLQARYKTLKVYYMRICYTLIK